MDVGCDSADACAVSMLLSSVTVLSGVVIVVTTVDG